MLASIPAPSPAVAEQRFRRLLADHDLPEPDWVEHSPGEVTFFFAEPRIAVVVQLDGEVSVAPGTAAPD